MHAYLGERPQRQQLTESNKREKKMIDLLKGRRLAGAMTNIAAAGVANAVTIFTLSTFAQMAGTKTVRVKKVNWRINAGVDTWVHIGTGAGATFVNLIPPVRALNNFEDNLSADVLPDIEATANLTAYADAVGANGVDVSVEVEEIG